jgi:Uma2 family endonuclease
MSAQTTMSVEEYRRASFDGADCDYVDGELLERNMGELEHGRIQRELLRRFLMAPAVEAIPEIRIQTRSSRFRVADVAVWRTGELPSTGIPPVPPFLAIEILSPEDRLVRMQGRIQEYLAAGVAAVWVVDPYDRAAIVYAPARPEGEIVDTLRTLDPAIAIPLGDLWKALEP